MLQCSQLSLLMRTFFEVISAGSFLRAVACSLYVYTLTIIAITHKLCRVAKLVLYEKIYSTVLASGTIMEFLAPFSTALRNKLV